MDKEQLFKAFSQFVEGLEKGKKEEGRNFRIMNIKSNSPNAHPGFDQYRYSFTSSNNEDHCLNLLVRQDITDVEFLHKQIEVINQLIKKIEGKV